IKIRGVDLMAKTQYDSDNTVTYTLTWDNSDGKKQSVSNNKSASNVATLFLQKLYTNNKSALSEIILFGFDLECLKERRIYYNQVQIQKNKKTFSLA
ncbi:1919_t:CDS:2, partial [Gigaspora margarita]